MKKKITALISTILAVVMSFALIACNGNDPASPNPDPSGPNTPVNPGTPDNPNNPGGTTITAAEATQKAVNAIKSLFEENGIKATVAVDCTTKSGADDMFVEYGMQKIGDRMLVDTKMKIDADSEYASYGEMLVDLTTGYAYVIEAVDDENIVTDYQLPLPAGLYDYIVTMYDKLTDGESFDTEEISKSFTYDSETSTLSYSYDGADGINDLTDPLFTAYKNKSSLTSLIDDYVDLLTGGAYIFSPKNGYNSIVKTITDFIPVMQNTTVDEIFQILKTSYNIDVDAILAEKDIDVAALLNEYFGIDTTWEQIKARKLGDIIVGAYNGIMQALAPQNPEVPDAPDQEEVTVITEGENNGIQSVSMQVLAYALNGAVTYEPQEGDLTAAEVANNLFATLIAFTDSIKVDTLIDEKLALQAPELAEFIRSRVQITKAKFDFSVKLNGDKLDTLNMGLEFAHNYSNPDVPVNYTFLADNDFKITASFKVDEILNDPEDLTFDGYNVNIDTVMQLPTAIVHGNVTEDVRVFIDFGGKQNDVNFNIEITLYDENAAEGDVVFDKATSCLVIKSKYFNEYFTAYGYGSMAIYTHVTYETENTYNSIDGNIVVTYMPEDPQELKPLILEFIQNFIGGIGGGDTPGDGVVGVE